MRRALLAFLGIIGLYGCYDYTLPTPAENKASPKTTSSEKKSEGDPLSPTSVDDAKKSPTSGDAPISPPETTSPVDAGTEASTTTTPTECTMKCANGCVNGTCNPPTQCVPGGSYCGGDKVNGDPDVLYKCGDDGFATTVAARCWHGCTVAPAGQDDYCN